MKTISRILLAAFMLCLTVALDAQTINVKLNIDDVINTQYSATFKVYDILGNTYTITSTNPVTGLQNGVNNITLTCLVQYDVNFPFYYISVTVRRMSQLFPEKTDTVGPFSTDELYQDTHSMGVTFP